ncbi:isochorismatase family protein [Natrialba sp. INN-245]|uniref:isochorismatase family protein n=1 Tax=Natrialba sp. INN-245 TaxID=2690967 RepID=UPI00190F13A4|nr:isochorismatase family protein [Natrialba sp. INN-245]
MYVPDVVPEEDRQTMVDKAEFGGEMGLGEEVAVLVVDMTREFVEDEYPNGYAETGEPAASAIARLMEEASERGIRGYYSRSLKGEHRVEAGQWGEADQTEEMTELTTELSPTEDDVVFEKYKPSVFFGTQLESMLNYSNVDTVIVTGMTTSGCVRATVVDAFSLNYRVIVPEECVADRSQVSHEVSLFDMDMKYADVVSLNVLIEALKEAP